MNDFTSLKEAYIFQVLGKVPKVEEMPFQEIDAYKHGLDLGNIEGEHDFVGLMQRFSKTFNGTLKPPGGGDVLFEFEQ